jgi:hypothetical protein
MTHRFPLHALLIPLAVCVAAFSLGRPADILFERLTIDLGASETAAFADINGDGLPDIVSGENWYEQPKTLRGKWLPHKFRDLPFVSTQYDNYVDNFSDLVVDVNGDGRLDVVSCAWFGKRLAWWANPGKGAGMWNENPIDSGFNTEFCFLVDLDNDGKAREVLPQHGGKDAPTVWFEISGGGFVKRVVGPGKGHGIGAGDVNGDKRADILTPSGWFEAPADPRQPNWAFHPDWSAEKQPGFMHVLDVNGDGRNDILYSNSHDYGIYWMERAADGKWVRQLIDETWSQAHPLELVDLNGDGKKDLVSGKRYMAHSRDPGAREALGLYWYEYNQSADGKRIEWTRHIIDYSSRSGGGMQIAVADIDKDGDLDLAAGGKSGLFLFENLTRRK